MACRRPSPISTQRCIQDEVADRSGSITSARRSRLPRPRAAPTNNNNTPSNLTARPAARAGCLSRNILGRFCRSYMNYLLLLPGTICKWSNLLCQKAPHAPPGMGRACKGYAAVFLFAIFGGCSCDRFGLVVKAAGGTSQKTNLLVFSSARISCDASEPGSR